MAKSKDKNEFGKRFQRLLRDVGCSQRKLAKDAGVPITTINNWTAGSAPTDFSAAMEVAKCLGVSLAYLLTGTDDNPHRRTVVLEDYFEPGEELINGICEIKIQRLMPRRPST